MKKTITKAKKAMFWIQRRDHQTPNCGKGALAGFSDVQEDAQEEGLGEEGAGEESAEEEGVQQYVPRYATMEEYAVGAEKARGSQTIDIHTVSTC